MSKRKEGGIRLTVGLVALFAMYVIGFFISLFLFVWALVDISWQIVTGKEGLGSDGWGPRIYDWMVDNTRYIYFGKGEWTWLP